MVQLRPTSPNRTTENIDDCISKFLPVINYFDCIRSVSLTSKTPYKTYTIDEYSNELVPLFRSLPNIKEPINSPRQILPTTYIHNGYIDVIKSTTILQKQSITGDRIYPYVMDSKDLDDIDTPDDWKKSEMTYKKRQRDLIFKEKIEHIKIIVIDCDGVLNDGQLEIGSNKLNTIKFHSRDLYGINSLRRYGDVVVFILVDIDYYDQNTITNSLEIKKRKNGRIFYNYCYYYSSIDGSKDSSVTSLLNERNLTWENMAYMGDDIEDETLIMKSALSGCPKCAMPEIIEKSHFVSTYNGGQGAVREFCDILSKYIEELKFSSDEKGKR